MTECRLFADEYESVLMLRFEREDIAYRLTAYLGEAELMSSRYSREEILRAASVKADGVGGFVFRYRKPYLEATVVPSSLSLKLVRMPISCFAIPSEFGKAVRGVLNSKR